MLRGKRSAFKRLAVREIRRVEIKLPEWDSFRGATGPWHSHHIHDNKYPNRQRRGALPVISMIVVRSHLARKRRVGRS